MGVKALGLGIGQQVTTTHGLLGHCESELQDMPKLLEEVLPRRFYAFIGAPRTVRNGQFDDAQATAQSVRCDLMTDLKSVAS